MSTGLYRWSPIAADRSCKGNTEGRLGRERKSLNRSKRKINMAQAVLEAWGDTEALAPVTTDPVQG